MRFAVPMTTPPLVPQFFGKSISYVQILGFESISKFQEGRVKSQWHDPWSTISTYIRDKAASRSLAIIYVLTMGMWNTWILRPITSPITKKYIEESSKLMELLLGKARPIKVIASIEKKKEEMMKRR